MSLNKLTDCPPVIPAPLYVSPCRSIVIPASSVIPAKAGIHSSSAIGVGPRLRGDDVNGYKDDKMARRQGVLLRIVKNGMFLVCLLATPAWASIYKRYLPDAITSLDPIVAHERYSQYIILQLFDPLFEMEDSLTPKPLLAKSFAYNRETMTYTILLREDVTFHDGKRMTAQDVVFTLRRMCKESAGSIEILPIIQGCRTKGAFGVRELTPFSVEIKTTEHFPPFISYLASINFMILPASLRGMSAKEFFAHPIGTGAFTLDKVTPSRITLKRYENYFLEKPEIEILELYIEPPEKIYELISQDAIDDIFPLPPPQSFPPSYTKTVVNLAATIFMGFQPGIAPFDNVYLRSALRAAIDNMTLHKEISRFEGLEPAKGVIPWGIIGFSHDMPDNYYNPGKIIPLLQKAGYKTLADVPEIEIRTILKPPYSPALPEAIKAQLVSAGFKVKLIYQNLSTFLTDVENKRAGAMIINLTNTSIDSYQFLELWRSNYRNPALIVNNKDIDQLLDLALQASDRRVRSEIYEKVNRIIDQNAYAHTIAYVTRQSTLYSKRWHVPKSNILGPFFMKMYSVKKNKGVQ